LQSKLGIRKIISFVSFVKAAKASFVKAVKASFVKAAKASFQQIAEGRNNLTKFFRCVTGQY
jgi:ABC-type microcin C transport system permease subunit YejE